MPAAAVRVHNLPAILTSFVGRAGEIGDLKRYLDSTRLVTLTGRDGVGKTRLATEAAVSYFENGVALLRDVGDTVGVAQAFTNLGEHARLNGDLQQARDAYEEALILSREIGDALRESILMIDLAFILLHDGSAKGAQGLLKESLNLALAFGHMAYTADKLSALAGAAVALGHPERAAVLGGAAEAPYERQGYAPQIGDIHEFERYRTSASEQLDAEAFETAWVEGRSMNLEEAIAYALENGASSLDPDVCLNGGFRDQGGARHGDLALGSARLNSGG